MLTLRIADHLARVPLLVAKHLRTDMIFGCNNIEKHVGAIHPKKSVLYMRNFSSVQIHRRPASTWKRTPAENEANKLKNDPFYLCRRIHVAMKSVLSPGSETIVLTQSADGGSFFLQPEETLFRSTSISEPPRPLQGL